MKLMSIFLVFKESMGERELEKVFSSYDTVSYTHLTLPTT